MHLWGVNSWLAGLAAATAAAATAALHKRQDYLRLGCCCVPCSCCNYHDSYRVSPLRTAAIAACPSTPCRNRACADADVGTPLPTMPSHGGDADGGGDPSCPRGSSTDCSGSYSSSPSHGSHSSAHSAPSAATMETHSSNDFPLLNK